MFGQEFSHGQKTCEIEKFYRVGADFHDFFPLQFWAFLELNVAEIIW